MDSEKVDEFFSVWGARPFDWYRHRPEFIRRHKKILHQVFKCDDYFNSQFPSFLHQFQCAIRVNIVNISSLFLLSVSIITSQSDLSVLTFVIPSVPHQKKTKRTKHQKRKKRLHYNLEHNNNNSKKITLSSRKSTNYKVWDKFFP